MPSQAWKQHERDTAKALLGKRIPRGANFSRSLPDVVADAKDSLSIPGVIFAECKYSAHMPWLNIYKSKIYKDPYKVYRIKGKETLLFFEIEHIRCLLDSSTYTNFSKINIPAYIYEYLEQAQNYISKTLSSPLDCITIKALSDIDIQNKKVLPIVCLRTKQDSTILCYTIESYFTDFIKND